MQISRRQIIAYAVLAAVVVAIGVRYLVLPDDSGSSGGTEIVLAPVASAPAAASPGAPASPAASMAPDLIVYVCGAVHSPGVVRLPPGGRVGDAVALAGGAIGKAELSAVNLAALVTDGQQIMVPERGAAPVTTSVGGDATAAAPGASGVAPSGGLININSASVTELDALDGVGPSTAQKIVDYRTSSGGFKTIEEMMNVPGIGEAKFAAMKDSITV
jgi:competence protein ComEA